jgi:hypothetical protein
MALSIYRSLPALGSLLFFSAFSNVIFGCIIFFFEAGTFTVDASEYPDGWYMRVDLVGDQERSPFESIPLAIYYSIVSKFNPSPILNFLKKVFMEPILILVCCFNKLINILLFVIYLDLDLDFFNIKFAGGLQT